MNPDKKQIVIQDYIKKAKTLAGELNFSFTELFAFLAGIKPALYRGLMNEEALEKIINNFPLVHFSLGNDLFCRSKQFIVLSWKQSSAELLKSHYERGLFNLVGQELGYPLCCISEHEKTNDNNTRLNQNKIIFDTLHRSDKCLWYNNHLFNFSSRLFTTEDLQYHFKLHQLNRDFPINLNDLEVIFHVPCRFDCPYSLKIGRAVWKRLKQYYPQDALLIKQTLKNPILFFNKFKWVIFKGYVANNILFYQDILKPRSLLNKSIISILRKGNKLIDLEDKIEVFKNNKILWVYHKKNPYDAFLINFR